MVLSQDIWIVDDLCVVDLVDLLGYEPNAFVWYRVL